MKIIIDVLDINKNFKMLSLINLIKFKSLDKGHIIKSNILLMS